MRQTTLRQPPQSFSLPQRLLHWTMAALILFNLAFPQGMGGTGLDLGFVASPAVHIGIGFAVLALATVRLVLRLVAGVPPEPAAAPPFFRVLARVGQWTFYALFFAVPATGLLAYHYGTPLALTLHAYVFRPVFLMLLTVHVGLALAHQYLWKTGFLTKIVRG